ncbi:DUF58 domain-containing protein [Microbacteriaceae bacterium 4G12]
MNKMITYHPLVGPAAITFVSILAAVLALFTSQWLLVFLCFTYLAFATIIRIRAKRTLFTLAYEQLYQHLFIDECGKVRVTLKNASHFPVESASLRFTTQKGVQWKGENVEERSLSYETFCDFKGRDRHEIALTVTSSIRGKIGWSKAEIIVRDWFGLVTIHRDVPAESFPHFFVYPKISKVKLPEPREWRYGFRNTRVSPLYDETKLIGVKEYEGEAFRSIHWGATAKTGKMNSKKYEPTQADRYAVYVNLAGPKGFAVRNDEEYLIEFAAGTCRLLMDQDCSFELWINAYEGNKPLHIPGGQGRKQLQKVLTLLSSVNEEHHVIASDTFYRNGFRQQEPASIPIVIGHPPNPAILKTMYLQAAR